MDRRKKEEYRRDPGTFLEKWGQEMARTSRAHGTPADTDDDHHDPTAETTTDPSPPTALEPTPETAAPTAVEPYRPTTRASIPSLHHAARDGPELPSFPSDTAPKQLQFDLPDFAPTVAGCPSWLLWLYDQAGGAAIPQTGRVAPAPMRLFIGALLHLGINDRDGDWHTVTLTTDEVISWLHPNGWANRYRDWDRFPASLHAMKQLAYLPIDGIGYMALLFPSLIPRNRSDPAVQFTVRVPPSAARGARIEWPRMCRYGVESATLYRAYLAVSAHLDRTAHRGHPITAEIAAPLDGPRGPRRRKDGRIARSRTEQVPNTAARYITPLTDADLTRMIGLDATGRDDRYKARRAFERLAEDGVIDLRRDGTDWWLFGRAPGQTADKP